MVQYLYKELDLDEIWLLFSRNPEKIHIQYASITQRIEMSQLLYKHYPNITTLIMSDFEEKLGSHNTYTVLTEIKKIHPDYHIIWAMGADSFTNLHTWEHFEELVKRFPIAVFRRKKHTKQAMCCPTAIKFKSLEVKNPQILTTLKSGWCILGNSNFKFTSSDIRKRLQSGKVNNLGVQFKEILKYIENNKLYNIKTNKRPKPVEANSDFQQE